MEKKNQRNVLDYKLNALAGRWSEGRPWALVTSQNICDALQITPRQAAQLFTRLLAQGRIQQLQRGLYLAPGQLPPGKLWKPNPLHAIWAFMDFHKVPWQLTGLAAFQHHGFSTQIPQRFSVYNTEFSGVKIVAGTEISFIQVKKERLGSIFFLNMRDGISIPMPTKVRTILDALIEEKRFGMVKSCYLWVAELARDKSHELPDLVSCALLFGTKSAKMRLGFFLDKLGHNSEKLFENVKIEKMLSRVSFVPGSRRGVLNAKWQIIQNESIENLLSELEVPDED